MADLGQIDETFGTYVVGIVQLKCTQDRSNIADL